MILMIVQLDELLNGEIFDTLTEAKILLEKWRKQYNEIRPHSSIGYKPPAPVTSKSYGLLTLKVDQDSGRRPHTQHTFKRMTW